MRAGQNFFEKVPFLNIIKSLRKIFYFRLDFFECTVMEILPNSFLNPRQKKNWHFPILYLYNVHCTVCTSKQQQTVYEYVGQKVSTGVV